MHAKPGVTSSHDRILQAAKHLFATRGYENTSTIMIARAAGTSESQLVKHFGSKDGLLEAIFDRGWESMQELLAVVEQRESPVEKLYTLVEQIMAGFERDSELKELMLLEGRRMRRTGNAVLLTQGFRQFSRRVEDVIVQMREQGWLRSELPAAALRSALIGMVEGMLRDHLLAQRMGADPGYSVGDIRRAVKTVLSSCLVAAEAKAAG